ncbi:hypothetical protein PHYSODRAFT_509235, partial [Phytophthora sojae]
KEGVIPSVGCARYRLNLTVKDFLKTEEELIAKVHAVTSKLITHKGRSVCYAVSPFCRLCYETTIARLAHTIKWRAIRSSNPP